MRKKKSLLNIISSLGSYFVTSIFTLITQAFIVKILGIEYSGINGLFTNVITMLSVAELGIGETIIFKLYEPIAKKDTEKIKSWMVFYKLCYRYVAIAVTIIGLLIIPILPVMVGKVSIKDNITLLYLITLIDCIFSYVMTYKRSLLYADQKNYVIMNVHMGYMAFMNITQIIVLVLFKDYIIYLSVKIIYRILENLILNIYVNKHYPYIKEKTTPITKEERKDIFERIKAIFLQKISFVINKGIDSIVISIMLGVSAVGYYTNYNLVALAVTGIIYQIISSTCASVGNLLTEKNVEKNYTIYKRINMINSFLTGIFMTGFMCCINPLIIIWVGKKYLLPLGIVISFVIYIYSDSIRRSITIFKEAAGICKEDKKCYIIMALINLIASILLCKYIGISGVILGTAISYLYLIIYSYPKYIFKPLFKKDYKYYHIENINYLISSIISIILSYIIINQITISNVFINLIINGIISVGIFSIIFILFFYKSEEYKYYYNLIKDNIKRR